MGSVGYSITSNSFSSLHGKRGSNRVKILLLSRLCGNAGKEFRGDRSLHPKYILSHNSVDVSCHGLVLYISFFKSTTYSARTDYDKTQPQRSNSPSMGTVQGRSGDNVAVGTG